MRRGAWLAIAALVVVAAGVTLLALPKGPEWTTSSPEALEEFQAAMEAQMKLYFWEAEKHFRRAYELDPDFLMAKLMYSDFVRREDKDRAKELWEEVLAADTSKLTPRERYFIERSRAYHDERPEDSARILDEYVAMYPDDPYILNEKALRTWQQGDLEKAERLYQRLIEISPNWVIAYNQLGYITMAQGRLTEAEEYFKSYRFIAPDQANPHDSLGELFIILGRYDEAEESLEKAMEIKPDFWASYQHMALMKAFTGDIEGARETIERAKAAEAPEHLVVNIDCLAHYAELAQKEAWQQVLGQRDSDCVKGFKEGYPAVITHLAACRVGELEIARGIEAEAADLLKKIQESRDEKTIMVLKGAINHMEGVRLASQGDLIGAEERLRAADKGLTFMEAGTGWFKLYNRVFLVEVLLAEGKDAEAHRLLGNVRSVNSAMVAQFEDDSLKVLGLGPG
ncbi:MAG: tetratricopeptide repeat protein [Thermoanaerobaculales bacterium]